MISIATHTSDRLVATSSVIWKRLAAGIITAIGLAAGLGAFWAADGFWILFGVGALMVVIGVAYFLFGAAYTYTFDKGAGQLSVQASRLVASSEDQYPLADIARLVSWRKVERDRDDDGSTNRRVEMRYLLEFTSGDSITIATNRRHNIGLISTLINTVKDSGVPKPIQTIADFLGVEVVDESPSLSGMVNKAANGISN